MVAAAAGVARWLISAQRANEFGSHVFGTRAAFTAFTKSSRAKAERLRCNREFGSERLADYRRDPAVSLSLEQIRQLQGLFTDRSSYSPELWDMPPGSKTIKTCGPPSYGVLFTFEGRRPIRIALCFRCNQFGVFLGNNDDDLIRAPLVRLVKQIFPADPQIQRLKEE
jgi:hypothetical protein